MECSQLQSLPHSFFEVVILAPISKQNPFPDLNIALVNYFYLTLILPIPDTTFTYIYMCVCVLKYTQRHSMLLNMR